MSEPELVVLTGTRMVTVTGWVRYPPMAEYDPNNWAHGIFTALAVTLAQPLHKAFADHRADCPLCSDKKIPLDRCPEGYRLYELLPAGDRITIG